METTQSNSLTLTDRREGDRRRSRRRAPALDWEQPEWVDGGDYSGPERRHGDRRQPLGGEPLPYSDEWARERGAASFNDWLDRCASAVPFPPRSGG